MADKLTSILLCVTMVSFLNVILHTTGSCIFPDFLQSNSSNRDWKGRIKDQNTEVTLQISITDNMIKAISTDSSAISYTRVCVRVIRDKYYLVAHEEQGQVGARFTCVQFVQRSEHVFQMRETPVGESMNRICNNNDLELNPWLIIDMNNVANDVQLSPLSGGFSVRIFDKKHGKGVCDGYQGQTRIESECVSGEGLYFHYRYRRCIPADIYMYAKQRTLCLGHWQEGQYAFALLRHDDRSQYMWVLRYPISLGGSFTMILFNDLVADMDPHTRETRNYLRLDTVRDTPIPATSLCVDDYEACTHREDACDKGLMDMVCPRTCGVCNATRPLLCTFDNKYQGQWYNAAQPGHLALTVNDTSLTTYNSNVHEQLQCIEWDREKRSNSKPFTKTQMLVREFNNGCKPRFSCIQFMQQSRSALFIKLSQGLAWPFTSTPREPIDCSNFIYEEEIGLDPNKFRSRNFNLVYMRASNTVSCDLPRTEGQYIATFREGDQCPSSIFQNQSANSFTLELTNCSGSELAGTYACADSTRMFPRRDQVVITRSGSNQDLIYCWLFPRKQHDVFYLVKASDCNDALRKRLSRGRLKPLVSFTRTGHIPELDYDYPNELPSIVSHPSFNQPAPTDSPDGNTTPFRKGDDSVYGPDWAEDGVRLNSSYPIGNSTASDGDMEITVTSVAVVSIVLVMVVLQTLCACNC